MSTKLLRMSSLSFSCSFASFVKRCTRMSGQSASIAVCTASLLSRSTASSLFTLSW